jgi:hypothetical protein
MSPNSGFCAWFCIQSSRVMNGSRRMSSSDWILSGVTPARSYRRRWNGEPCQARCTSALSRCVCSARSWSFGRVSVFGFQ